MTGEEPMSGLAGLDGADLQPSRHGHKHLAEWNPDGTKLYLHEPGSVATHGAVELTEDKWWWWCLHDGCMAGGWETKSTDAWSAFLGHEWCSHLSAIVEHGGSVAIRPDL